MLQAWAEELRWPGLQLNSFHKATRLSYVCFGREQQLF